MEIIATFSFDYRALRDQVKTVTENAENARTNLEYVPRNIALFSTNRYCNLKKGWANNFMQLLLITMIKDRPRMSNNLVNEKYCP